MKEGALGGCTARPQEAVSMRSAGSRRRDRKPQHKTNAGVRISRLSFFSHQGVGRGVVTKLHLNSSHRHATMRAHRNSSFSVWFLPFLQRSFICYGRFQLMAAGWELCTCWAVERSRSVDKIPCGSDCCSYMPRLQQRQGLSQRIRAAQSGERTPNNKFPHQISVPVAVADHAASTAIFPCC